MVHMLVQHLNCFLMNLIGYSFGKSDRDALGIKLNTEIGTLKDVDCSSLGFTLASLLGSSLGTRLLGENLSYSLGKSDCISLGTTLSLLLGHSLGCTLGEPECKSPCTKILVWNLVHNFELMWNAWGSVGLALCKSDNKAFGT